MSDPRDTEIVKRLRAGAFNTEPKVPWSHFGKTVYLEKNTLTFVAPVDHMAWADILETLLPHFHTFMSACSWTRDLDQSEIITAFLAHWMTPSPDNPKRNYQRYEHNRSSAASSAYECNALKCFCTFLKEHYKPEISYPKPKGVQKPSSSPKPVRCDEDAPPPEPVYEIILSRDDEEPPPEVHEIILSRDDEEPPPEVHEIILSRDDEEPPPEVHEIILSRDDEEPPPEVHEIIL